MTHITLVGAGEYTDLETLEQESYLRFRATSGALLSLPCSEEQMRTVLGFLGETAGQPDTEVVSPSAPAVEKPTVSVPSFPDEEEDGKPVTLRPLARSSRDPSPFAGKNEDL